MLLPLFGRNVWTARVIPKQCKTFKVFTTFPSFVLFVFYVFSFFLVFYLSSKKIDLTDLLFDAATTVPTPDALAQKIGEELKLNEERVETIDNRSQKSQRNTSRPSGGPTQKTPQNQRNPKRGSGSHDKEAEKPSTQNHFKANFNKEDGFKERSISADAQEEEEGDGTLSPTNGAPKNKDKVS
jgi:hypothetical protein